jgi:predicted nuclease with TOPRIM domain
MSEDTELEVKPVKGMHNVYALQEKGCGGCEAKSEYITSLKEALGEVVDENEALRNRVVELEAWVNKAADKIEKRDRQIEDTYASINTYGGK